MICQLSSIWQLLKNFNVSLGSGELNGQPEVLFLKLENVDCIDAVSQLVCFLLLITVVCGQAWAIKFPEDLEVALEQWADTGDPSKEERWQHAISDRGLFSVEPRYGNIKAVCMLAFGVIP